MTVNGWGRWLRAGLLAAAVFSADAARADGGGASITYFGGGTVDVFRAGAVLLGERLYNGIVLPQEWPPRTVNPRDTAPMAVPYLKCPPKIVPIDVGRQLFVDDFLIATTTLRRVCHQPKKFGGNPILKPETPLELHGDKNSAAVPKSGGVWWNPAERIFKMWYEAGWIGTICYATSPDGLNWTRPSLDVRPGTNQVLPLN